VGVIAQELEKVAPELIVKEEVTLFGDDFETEISKVNYSKFIWMAINSIKDLYTMVLELFDFQAETQREIASLKEENEAMKKYLCEKDTEAPFCLKK